MEKKMRYNRKVMQAGESDVRVLAAAYTAWNGWDALRSKRMRMKNFTYGKQWGDLVRNSEGRMVTEYEKIADSGKEPLTNNLIRQLVKSVVGRFRSQIAESPQSRGRAIGQIYKNNYIDELDSRSLEEFLISGCCVQRVDKLAENEGVRVDNVNVNRVFSNAIEDVRGWDCEIVGCLHDMGIGELIERLANGDRDRAKALRNVYSTASDDMIGAVAESVGCDMATGGDFWLSHTGKCRAIEVWTLEMTERLRCHDRERAECYDADVAEQAEIDKENARRKMAGRMPIDVAWGIAKSWHCRWFAPSGEVLSHYVSPYSDGQHPFVMKFYPLTDGEVHSFVEDVIDQQKYVNRLITLVDHIMGASAKGVLLFPDTALPDGFTWKDIKKMWSSCNGVIPFSQTMNSMMPQQVTGNATNVGAYEMLSLQMKLLEEISGVSGALQGKNVTGAVGAGLYEQQVQNASIALKDIFETFNVFRNQRDEKLESFNGNNFCGE